jgi:hypothetical protein
VPAVDWAVARRISVWRIDGKIIGYEPGHVIADWLGSHRKTGRVQSDINGFMDSGTLFRVWSEIALIRPGKVDAAWVVGMGVVVVKMGAGDCELQLYAES